MHRMGQALPIPRVDGERWMKERWPRFGFYAGLVLVGWLLLGFLPWWTASFVVVMDAAWSAGRGDWSLVAFLTYCTAVVAVVAVGARLLL